MAWLTKKGVSGDVGGQRKAPAASLRGTSICRRVFAHRTHGPVVRRDSRSGPRKWVQRSPLLKCVRPRWPRRRKRSRWNHFHNMRRSEAVELLRTPNDGRRLGISNDRSGKRPGVSSSTAACQPSGFLPMTWGSCSRSGGVRRWTDPRIPDVGKERRSSPAQRHGR